MRIQRAFGALCVLLVGVGCQGRHRASSTGGSHDNEPRSGPAVAIVDLSGGLPEQPSTGLLGLPSKAPSFVDFVREVDRLAHDKDVRGVLVRLGTGRIGLARSEEIGALLANVGRRVPVWCHADDLTNATAYLAARACKRIWLSPAASVETVGLAAQSIYFHKLLADELGLDVDFLQVGKYKGAEEPFTRDGPSPEARASLESTLSDMRSTWLAGLRSARPAMREDAPEDGPYSAPSAKERGLIDDVGYIDEARDALEKESSAVRAVVRLGGGASSGDGDDLSDLLRSIAGESIGPAPVALVRADGAISLEGGGGLLGEGGGIVEKRLVRTLTRLERDDDVRAVVLRIDSPGGSALASDLLWHALMRIRSKKPLVVSIGGMAASGGYYLASTGSVVYAEDTSIVGSIGVVGGKIAADRALERIGVHAETIAARGDDPKAGARAAFESLLVPWDAATRGRLLETMTAIYQLFLARVAEGRSIPVDRVAASAEGRIFSGREGKSRGLVDEIGGLADAISKARALASLPDDARFASVGEGGGLLEALGEDDPPSAGPILSGIPDDARLGDLVLRIAPELRPFLAAMAELSQHERVLVALPFALEVR